MKRSTNRILTTHVGSLIRPPQLRDFLQGKNPDREAHERFLTEAVAEAVRQQAQIGIDVISDGEFGKAISWSQYAFERLSGFEQRPVEPSADPINAGADRARFPEFYNDQSLGFRTVGRDTYCVGPIKYTGQAQLQRDIDNFKAALKFTRVEEAFLPVAAPASVIPDRKNDYYRSDEDCVAAIAEAMRTEYKMIIDAGFILQLDDARAAVTYDRMVPPGTLKSFRRWVGFHIEALNHALRGLPEDRIRYHVCWGSWPGPHTTDVPLKDIVDLILKVKAGAYVIEGANPRHAHEWKLWSKVRLPKDRILIPGTISHATNVVEHPELVAERIVRLANLIGRENVIAGTDCGFAQGPTVQRVHPSIQWAKLKALVDGARLATTALWPKVRRQARASA
jgi:5-methyltetrahydropteroyltriglutamate--homocysteine methyltransferase